MIAAVSGELNVYSSAVLFVTVAASPGVASVKATALKKGHKNKGIGTITVTFSQAMAESAGSPSFYSVVTPKIVRVRKKKETRLVPVPFTSKLVAPDQVQIQLTKPSKLKLQLIVRGAVTSERAWSWGRM